MQKFTLFLLLLSFPPALMAQRLDALDDELPIAPLRGEDAPARKMPPKASLGPSSNNDIAKVVPAKCLKPKGKFPWNLDKAKLSDLVDQISRLTCRNFIISSGVKPSQEISIISRTPITVEQAWQAFQSTLEANELSLFKTGDYYKIIKRADATKQPIPVVDEKGALPQDEGMVTFLYDLKHIQKDIAQSLVKGLISRVGDVIVVGETFLVITDSSSNIRRVMNILGKVDVFGAANRIHIVDLVHADAVQIQTKLNDIFTSLNGKSGSSASPARSPYDDYPGMRGGGGGDNFSLKKMIADERTNKLIVIASDKAFDRIKEMIDVLDVPSSGAGRTGQIYVYYLKHGDAKKMATTLSTLVQGLKTGSKSSGSTPGFGAKEELFESEIKVTADEATNSLVCVASPRDYKALINVIAKLDKKRTQVYVEAAIMEVALSDNSNFGLGAFGGIPFSIGGQDSTMILSNPAGKSLATDVFGKIGTALASNNTNGVAAAGLAPFLDTIGFVGPGKTLTLNGSTITVPGIGAILNIIQTYSNVDILSTPSLMTLDNEKAEMSVGERIPTLGSVSTMGLGTGTGGLGIPLQNVQYQEPKLKFTLTPHVNDDNQVRLEIEQDISDVGENIKLNNVDYPKFTTKTAKTTVSSRDQQTVILGGMISESYKVTEGKIPWLGDIPLLGHLFKTTSKMKIKKNLMLILTPYVVRNENDLRKIYDRKTKEREEFSKLYFGDKITKFDPYIDYDKKSGPLSHLIDQVQHEMQKTENGGTGLPGETLFKAPVHDDKEKHKTQLLEQTDVDEGNVSETQVPVTETTVTDQPPVQTPEPAPIVVEPAKP
ncbi:MAG: type II secretion system secretin GspD [Myxococcaceae bacterium]